MRNLVSFVSFACLYLTVNCASTSPRVTPKIEIEDSHYRIIRSSDNAEISLSNLLQNISSSNVIIIGETHNDPVAHFIELEVVKGITEIVGSAVVSLEMFERDVQSIINEYLDGRISEEFLIKDARAWSNYLSDYKPVIEFAKEKKLKVIAANAPRRYIRMVSSRGMESLRDLSVEALQYISPLPINPPKDNTYRDKFFKQMLGSGSDDPDQVHGRQMSEEVRNRIFSSQMLWDATMAYSIGQQFLLDNETPIVHFNGSFHSDEHLGIAERLKSNYHNLELTTITVLPVEDISTIDSEANRHLADFVVYADKRLPRTYSSR